tara:strand:+ start:633 stop:1034 length:402 start_codon:yes stop_codon:yes gene_type:complete
VRYTETLKSYILQEAGELDVRSKIKQRQRRAKRMLVRSVGKRNLQKVARAWMDARRSGDTVKTARLLQQYKDLEGLNEKKDWIQGAVKNPGRCTPMPNPDCPVGSPQYNLGKRFKKAARKKKRKGGTGWQGKV